MKSSRKKGDVMLKKLFKFLKLLLLIDDEERNYCKFSSGYINYKRML